MRIRYKLWLEDDSGVLFGRGRLELLKAVAELGSLSAAAKQLEMSYRAAWGRLKASEDRLGLSLMTKGPAGRGLILTPEAERILKLFIQLENEVEQAIAQAGGRLFDGQALPSLKLGRTD